MSKRELKILEEADIDAAFADLANDEEYRAEAELLEKEYAPAGWEALQIGEAE